MNPFGSKDLTALAATLSPVTPKKMIRRPEPAKSEQARQQAQEDQAGPSGPQAQQSQAGSSDQRTAPGRMPLFRSYGAGRQEASCQNAVIATIGKHSRLQILPLLRARV